jgi:serine/threonine protein phosphatase PrpC
MDWHTVHRAETRGRRASMEDRHVVMQQRTPLGAVLFAGVYDGHGGADVADLAAERLHAYVFDSIERGAGIEQAFRDGYARLASEARHEHVGSTACTAAFAGRYVTVAWVGDSQFAVVDADGVRFLSIAHRIDDTGERRRVAGKGAAFDGPYVMRGDHGLMMTRSLGDTWFHAVGLTSTPAVETIDLEREDDALIVLATDGLWDVIDADDIVRLFRVAPRDADHAALFVGAAMSGGTRDNVTVVTITCRAG